MDPTIEPPASPRVIVACGGLWHTMLAIPGLLHRAGCRVTVVCPRLHPSVGSRFAERIVEYSGINAEGVARVRDLLARGEADFVIWTDETLIREMLNHVSEPLLVRSLPVPATPETLASIADKFGLATFGPAAGVPYPIGRVCHSREEADEFLSRSSPSPIILKPIAAAGGQGVSVVHTNEEIARWMEGQPRPFLVQEFVRGRIGITEMVLRDGAPLAWMASYQVAHLGGEFGPSTRRQLCRPSGMQHCVERIGALTRFTGFCGFDWIEEAGTGRVVVMEFHARPTAGFAFGERWGVDFSRAIKRVLTGAAGGVETASEKFMGCEADIFPVEMRRMVAPRHWPELAWWLLRGRFFRFLPWHDLGLLRSTVRYYFRPTPAG